jgi:hypothetical protein
MHGLNYLRPVFFFCNKRCRKKGKRKALPGDDEGEGGDEDESDGLVWRMFFFPLLLCFFFFCYGFSFSLVFFWFFVPLCSALFFSVSPLFPLLSSDDSLAFYRGRINCLFPSTPLLSLAKDKSCRDLDIGFNPYLL